MEIVKRAKEFQNVSLKSLTRNEKIEISREAKELILGLNEIYKKTKDSSLLDIMKNLTAVKKQAEKRLYPKLSA